MTDSPLLIARECAEILHVSVRGFRDLVATGRFPAPIVLSARRHRWTREDVEAWLTEQKADAGRRRAATLGKADPATFRIARSARRLASS